MRSSHSFPYALFIFHFSFLCVNRLTTATFISVSCSFDSRGLSLKPNDECDMAGAATVLPLTHSPHPNSQPPSPHHLVTPSPCQKKAAPVRGCRVEKIAFTNQPQRASKDPHRHQAVADHHPCHDHADHAHQLDQNVQTGTAGILERVTDGIANHACFMGI